MKTSEQREQEEWLDPCNVHRKEVGQEVAQQKDWVQRQTRDREEGRERRRALQGPVTRITGLKSVHREAFRRLKS